MNTAYVKEKYIKHEKSILLTTIVLFLFIRIFMVFTSGNFDKSTFKDAGGYNEYAKEIISGTDWITNPDFMGSIREPVYPIFVAAIYAIFGAESFLAVYLIQAILSSLMLWLIYRIAILTVRSRAVAYLSLLWSGFYIFYLRWIGELLRETLIIFFFSCLLFLLIKYLKEDRSRIRDLFLLALVYTLLIHTDGRYLFYSPILIIPFLIYLRPLWVAIKRYVIFACFVLLLTAPWTVRNYLAYGDLIVVSDLTLNLTGSKLSARGELFNLSDIETAGHSLHFNKYNAAYPTDAERDSIFAGSNPQNRTESELKAIRKGKRAATSYLGRKWYFYKKMWSPINVGGAYAPFPMAYFEEGYSKGHNLISILQYGLVLPFAIIGIILILGKRKRLAYMLIFPIASHMVLHFLAFGIERYRHPVDAFIIILGMYGLVSVIQCLLSILRMPSRAGTKLENSTSLS